MESEPSVSRVGVGIAIGRGDRVGAVPVCRECGAVIGGKKSSASVVLKDLRLFTGSLKFAVTAGIDYKRRFIRRRPAISQNAAAESSAYRKVIISPEAQAAAAGKRQGCIENGLQMLN